MNNSIIGFLAVLLLIIGLIALAPVPDTCDTVVPPFMPPLETEQE